MKKQLLFCAVLFFMSVITASAQMANIISINPVCNNDGVLVASHNLSPGLGYYYYWSTNDASVMHYTNDMTDTLFNFKGGPVYIYILPDNGALGAYGSNSFPFPFSVNQTIVADTCPLQTGSISLIVNGGVAPVNYSWTYNGLPFGGNTPSLSNLTAGLYDCLISDAAGCQMYLSDTYPDSSVNGMAPPNVPSVNNLALTIGTTPAGCTNGTATAIVVGGQAPYTYLWSNLQTTQTATSLTSGAHSVLVTDANSCLVGGWVWVPSSVTININQSVTHAHCSFTDGAITVIPTGGTSPYSYMWNTMDITPTISNIPGGNYQVTVSDAAGCVGNAYIFVNSLTPVNVNYSITPSQCLGATGSVTANVSGGIAPYTYEWYTSPVQTTPTATALAPGNYNFKVTDSQGCTQTGTVTVLQNTTLNMSMSTTASVCTQNNGTATMVAAGGSPPYSYLWSNSQTTAVTTNLPVAMMYGTVTDALGCVVSDCMFVPYQSPLFFNLVPQVASCLYTADGSISVNIINGTPPYTYAWSNGQNTPSISGLLPGTYSLLLTDANGCMHYQIITLGYASVNPCTSLLTGRVYIDLNNDCIYSVGEPVMQNIPISCSTINEVDFTDINGIYSFQVPAGLASLQQLSVPYRYQACPSANPFTVNIPATGLIVTRDIADSVDWVNDLTVDMWNLSSPPVVGSTYIKRVVEFNRGTQALSSTNQYDYETQAPYSFATVAPSTYQPGISRATWDNPLALPLVSRQYDVTHSVPVSVPINTLLVYTDTIFPVTGDTTWWDNNLLKIDNTVGSYDPNYKEVSPEGTGPQGYISLSDSVLEYVIHFQNIGNYYATNIRITDQIDSDLEISTMRVVYSTHLQQTHINASGEIEFYFPNINLPALSMDSIESNGFVVYTIHLKPGLAPGTEIENSADIYFDFNPPITTNTTLNTIFTTGVDEHPALTAVSVFPNPNDGSFSVYFPNEISGEIVIRLFNITGQTIMERRESVAGRSLLKIEESNLTSGVYFLQVEINGVQKNVKLVVQ